MRIWNYWIILCPWDSPGKNTRVRSHSLLQGNLPNSGIEPGSPALQADTLPFEPWEKTLTTKWSIFFFFFNPGIIAMDFPGGMVVKTTPTNAGKARLTGSIPGWGTSPAVGKGNPFYDSCLENSQERGAWWATVHWVTKNQTWLHTHAMKWLLCSQAEK